MGLSLEDLEWNESDNFKDKEPLMFGNLEEGDLFIRASDYKLAWRTLRLIYEKIKLDGVDVAKYVLRSGDTIYRIDENEAVIRVQVSYALVKEDVRAAARVIEESDVKQAMQNLAILDNLMGTLLHE